MAGRDYVLADEPAREEGDESAKHDEHDHNEDAVQIAQVLPGTVTVIWQQNHRLPA